MRSSDVSGLILTLGEPYTERALASLKRQSSPAAEVIAVRNTAPFHRAFNEGVARVRTPFFIQIDADMILDATCIADLRACVAERVGVVIGHLRDPLLGRIAGVKLFRTACFEHGRFSDSISPDTDFYNAIGAYDWRTLYALKPPSDASARPHVFGDHRPDYSPLYTFRKYMLQGARHRYRRAAGPLFGLLRRLHASRHDGALFALIGTAHGIFLPTQRDLLRPLDSDADFERLAKFLQHPAGNIEPPVGLHWVAHLDVRAAWDRGYRYGLELHRKNAPGALVAALRLLGAADHTIAWVVLVGICHGLFADAYDERIGDLDFALLNQVLPSPYRRRDVQAAPAPAAQSPSISLR